MKDELRWGILGTGMIAGRFARELPESRTGTLVATGSRSPAAAERFAQEHGGVGKSGYEAVVADPAVDAVYVALPNGLHEEWSIRAMEAGKDVLCEKPLARDEAEGRRILQAADRLGRTCVEAFMYRTAPLIEDLVGRVRSGVIGELRLLRLNFTFDRPVEPGDARYDPEQGGGALMDVGCYCTHFARTLAGREPTEAVALAHRHPSGVDDYAAGCLGFDGDLLVTFTCGMTVKSDRGAFLAGTEGTISLEAFWQGLDGFVLRRGDREEFVPSPGGQPPYAREADAFRAVVREGAAPWITPEDTLGNLRVLDRLRHSAGLR